MASKKGNSYLDSAFDDAPSSRDALADAGQTSDVAGVAEPAAAPKKPGVPEPVAGASNAPAPPAATTTPVQKDNTPAPGGSGAKTVGQVQSQLAAAMPQPAPQVSIPGAQPQAAVPQSAKDAAAAMAATSPTDKGAVSVTPDLPTGKGNAREQLGDFAASQQALDGIRDALGPTATPQANLPAASIPADLFDVNAIAPRDAFARGPTGFVDYNQFYGANAGTAQRAMQAVADRVRGTGAAAQNALANGFADFRTAADAGANGVTGEYTGPAAFDTSVYDDAFTDAAAERDALGMGAGGVQALTGGSRFGSELTNTAGGREFGRVQRDLAGLDTARTDAAAQGAEYADTATERALAELKAAQDAQVARERAEDEARRQWEAQQDMNRDLDAYNEFIDGTMAGYNDKDY